MASYHPLEQDTFNITVGVVLSQITPVDTGPIPQTIEIIESKCYTVGITTIEPTTPTVMGDTIAIPVERSEVLKEEIKEAKDMDTVNVIGLQTVRTVSPTSCNQIISGMISVENKETQTNKNEIKLNDLIEDANVTVYPNPVKAGSQITITSPNDKVIHQLQLFSSSGALIKTTQTNNQSDVNNKFSLPASISSGTYFLRVILQGEKIKTAKIIVTN